MSKIVVSVIIPIFNQSAFLLKALQSVAEQNDKYPTEIILVNDHSTDNPERVWRLFQQHHPQFVYRYKKIYAHNASRARNVGLSMSRGQIVVFLDADNQLRNNFMASHIRPILNDEADVVYAEPELIGFLSRYPYPGFNLLSHDFASLFLTSSIDSCCAVRQSKLSQKPWDPKLERWQDWDFHLSNMQKKLRYKFLPFKTWRYYISSNEERERKDYVSQKAYDSAFAYIREKHQPRYMPPKLTVVAQTIGRYYCAKDWLNSLLAQDFPKKETAILFLDNSNDEQFVREYLVDFINRHGHLYHSASILTNHQKKYFSPAGEDPLAVAKIKRFSNILQQGVAKVASPYWQTLEDDTLIPPNAFTKLHHHLIGHPDAIGAQAVQRSRVAKFAVVAYAFNAYRIQNIFYQRKETGLTEIDCGGTGCAQYQTEWVQRHNALEQHPFPLMGADINLGWKIKQSGQKLLTDWSLNAEHSVLAESGQIHNLNIHQFSNPSSLFPQKYLKNDDYYTPAEQPSNRDDRRLIIEYEPDNPNFAGITNEAFAKKPTYLIVKKAGSEISSNWNNILGFHNEPIVIFGTSKCRAVYGFDWQNCAWPITTKNSHASTLINLDYFIVKPKKFTQTKFLDPKFASEPALLELALHLALHRTGVQPRLNLALFSDACSQFHINNRPKFFLLLGELISLEVPFKKYLKFYRNSVKKILRANFWERCLFWIGIIKDHKNRVAEGDKRHFFNT